MARLVAEENAPRFFLFFVGILFLVSLLISSFLQDSIYRSELYTLKYLTIAILTLLTLRYSSKKLVLFPAIIISLTFIVGGQLLSAISALSCLLISYGIAVCYRHKSNDWFFYFLLALFLLPIMFFFWSDATLYSTKYGRPRIPLGYDHPKESSALIFFIGAYFLLKFKNAAACIAIFFMSLFDSRNSLIGFSILYLSLCFSRRHFFILVSFFVVSGSTLAIVLILNYGLTDMLVAFNDLSSNRLEIWIRGFSERFSSDSSIFQFSVPRQYYDSFWVEVYVLSGYLGLLSATILVFYLLSFISIERRHSSGLALGAFAALIFLATFDSGIASPGNFIHISVWALFFYSSMRSTYEE
jgi:hypothetical protein